MTMMHGNETAAQKALQVLRETRTKVLSTREWQHVLRGYGYALRKTDTGTTVLRLPHNHEICDLPADLCA